MPDESQRLPKRSVTFMYEGTFDLDEDDIWPDGDAPENWTVQDVAEVIKNCHGALYVLRDWDLIDALTLDLFDGTEGVRVP